MNIPINQLAPNFSLPDLEGKFHQLSAYRGKVVVLNFWSCECPHSQRTDKAIASMLINWNGQVVMLPIAANRNESAQMVKVVASDRCLSTVLLDAQCSVANLYGARTTPHIFVIDRDGILRYRGAVDDVTFRKRNPSRVFLDEAVKLLLNGGVPALAESPAYGCTIVREV